MIFFVMKIDIYCNLYLILNRILQYICDTWYNTWYYDTVIRYIVLQYNDTCIFNYFLYFLKKIKLIFFLLKEFIILIV